MNPHKLIQFYFECLDLAGEQMSFDLIKLKAKGTETLSFNHLNYDGVSALCEHVPTLPGKSIIPELRYQAPPSFIKRMISLSRWWMSVSYRSFFIPQGQSQEGFLFGTRVITLKDETNLNARILQALHQAMETAETSLWMIPVSLHQNVALGMKPQNNVSFIDIKVKTTDSAVELKSKINQQLKNGSYWGTIYSMMIPRLLGKALFIKTFPYFRIFLRRTGTFTNVGKWQVEGLEENESWGIKATVVSLNPLGASALQVNNRLTIGLQTHPSLGLTNERLDRILDLWQTALQNQLPS
ncbi:MAG: hypothetical protein H0V66_02765 [Bdellovibrionales bacterium]|nr:hypothetical protein [Bdellovibrionales bacterium]